MIFVYYTVIQLFFYIKGSPVFGVVFNFSPPPERDPLMYIKRSYSVRK